MSKSLQKLIDEVVEDGRVDADEVEALRNEVYDDGIVDRDEADLLFKLNTAVSGNPNDPSFTDFMVDAIVDHLTKDEDSPGEIDQDEADWLISRMEGDGKIDKVELAILHGIVHNVHTLLPENLIKFMNDNGVPATSE